EARTVQPGGARWAGTAGKRHPSRRGSDRGVPGTTRWGCGGTSRWARRRPGSASPGAEAIPQPAAAPPPHWQSCPRELPRRRRGRPRRVLAEAPTRLTLTQLDHLRHGRYPLNIVNRALTLLVALSLLGCRSEENR